MKTNFIVVMPFFNSLEEGTEIKTHEGALKLIEELALDDTYDGEATIIEVANTTVYDIKTETNTTIVERK